MSRRVKPDPVTDEHDAAALFRAAVADARPLAPANRIHHAPRRPPAVPLQHLRDEREALRESLVTPLSVDDHLLTGEETHYLRPGISRLVLRDLRRGRWVVQAELDLHGCTREHAHTALGEFLAHCLIEGKRCVRVIHGKGLGSPNREPVLKHAVRGWLVRRKEVLAFCQPRPVDGGSGAVLILLRGAKLHPQR